MAYILSLSCLLTIHLFSLWSTTKEKEIYKDLNKINSNGRWEVLFSRKLHKESHSKLLFNNEDVSQTNSQKHFGVALDSKLTSHDHLDIVFTEVRKTICLLRQVNSTIPGTALVTTFKTCFRPHQWLCRGPARSSLS